MMRNHLYLDNYVSVVYWVGWRRFLHCSVHYSFLTVFVVLSLCDDSYCALPQFFSAFLSARYSINS